MTPKTSCAYCGKSEKVKFTREHVIPAWWLKLQESEIISFSERDPRKMSSSELVIKDVCSDCNNGALANLDGYGKTLYLKYFSKPVFEGEQLEFTYNFEILAKWLLKISYNSARVSNSDARVLSQLRRHLISEKPLPKYIQIYVGTISPSESGFADRQSEAIPELIFPTPFRVGVVSIPGTERFVGAKRSVIIGSLRFWIFVPDTGSPNFKKQGDTVQQCVHRYDLGSVRLRRQGSVRITPPTLDLVASLASHMLNNPVAIRKYFKRYDSSEEVAELERNIEAVHDSKADIFHFVISSEDVVGDNVSAVAAWLNSIFGTRENALKFIGKCEFSIYGYENDARELWDIPEVRLFIQRVTDKFRGWLAMQHEGCLWLKVLILCSVPELAEQDFKFPASNFKKFSDVLFLGLNEVTDRCNLSVDLNKKQSFLLTKAMKELFPKPS